MLLPVIVCQDGFTITHSAEPVVLLRRPAVSLAGIPVEPPQSRKKPGKRTSIATRVQNSGRPSVVTCEQASVIP